MSTTSKGTSKSSARRGNQRSRSQYGSNERFDHLGPRDICDMDGEMAKITLAMVLASIQANPPQSNTLQANISRNESNDGDGRTVSSAGDDYVDIASVSEAEVPTRPATPARPSSPWNEFEDDDEFVNNLEVEEQRAKLRAFFNGGGALAPELVRTPPSSPVAVSRPLPSTPARVYQAAIGPSSFSRAPATSTRVYQSAVKDPKASQSPPSSPDVFRASANRGASSGGISQKAPAILGSKVLASNLVKPHLSKVERIPFASFNMPDYSGYHCADGFYAVARGREVGIFTSWGEVSEYVINLSRSSYQREKTFKLAVQWLATAAATQGGFLERITNA